MTMNIGNLDRMLRLVIGAVLLLAALFSGVALFDGIVVRSIAVIVGIVLIATAGMRFYPLYTVFGIRTCKV